MIITIMPKVTVLAIVLLSISAVVSAGPAANPDSLPVPVPDIYNLGPASPLLNMTNMRDSERAAFALAEALLQVTEAVVYVKGCEEFEADIEVYSHPDSNTHFIQDTAFGGVRLIAALRNPIAGFGQQVVVGQPVQGVINGAAVQRLRGVYTFNSNSNLMVNERTGLEVKGQLRTFDQFYSSVIKDFYHGNTYDSSGDFYELFDYGLQSLSKFGYPVNKWWQKSKSVRDDGQQGCTVFQKDRLVGAGVCRITLATTGLSQPGFFWQSGTLKVSTDLPNINETELDTCAINPIF